MWKKMACELLQLFFLPGEDIFQGRVTIEFPRDSVLFDDSGAQPWLHLKSFHNS